MSIEGDQFNHQLDKFLSDFSEDEQERILRYALDHIVPKLRTCATSQQAEAPQPTTAVTCGIPGMVKTTCPYCEQGVSFEYTE